MTKFIFETSYVENGIDMGVKIMKFEVIYTSNETQEKGLKEQTWTYETPNTCCHLEYVLEEFANFCINEHLHNIEVKDVNFWDVHGDKEYKPELV